MDQEATLVKRGRGRPKGGKNRPKEITLAEGAIRKAKAAKVIPDWLVSAYGRQKAVELYRTLVSRWNLVTYNLDPSFRFDIQVEFMKEVLFGKAMEVWWFAGNRGAKSEGGCAVDTVVVTGILPLVIGGTGFEDKTSPIEPCDVWISSLDNNYSRDVIRPKIERYMPEDWLKDAWSARDLQYRLPNGSTLGLKSQDAGASKYMGVSRKLIHLDEEHDEDIYDECIARVMDQGGKVVSTLTPMHGMSYSYDRAWVEAGMEPDPTSERRDTEILRYVQTKNFDKLRVFHSRTEDNPYLPHDAIERVADRWKDKNVKKVRLGGLHTLIKGSHVFPVEKVQRLQESCVPPIHEDKEYGIRVFEEPDPGVYYKIGVDVSKGKVNGDPSCAVVLDPLNRKVVAKMKARVDAVNFAIRVHELAHRYNTAEVVVERQDHGIVVINELRRLSYPRIWRRKSIGRVLERLSDDYGFSTDVVGKAQLVSAVYTAVEDLSIEIPDREIVDEFSWFIHYDDKLPEGRDRHKMVGRCGAMRGKHDDSVIALGLALIASTHVVLHRNPKEDKDRMNDPYAKQLGEWSEKRRVGPPILANDGKYGFRIRRIGGRG